MTSSAFDANGNRILRVSRREANGADVADVETAERVIQVVNLFNNGFSYILVKNIIHIYPSYRYLFRSLFR